VATESYPLWDQIQAKLDGNFLGEFDSTQLNGLLTELWSRQLTDCKSALILLSLLVRSVDIFTQYAPGNNQDLTNVSNRMFHQLSQIVLEEWVIWSLLHPQSCQMNSRHASWWLFLSLWTLKAGYFRQVKIFSLYSIRTDSNLLMLGWLWPKIDCIIRQSNPIPLTIEKTERTKWLIYTRNWHLAALTSCDGHTISFWWVLSQRVLMTTSWQNFHCQLGLQFVLICILSTSPFNVTMGSM
jgi:hypothetical protein